MLCCSTALLPLRPTQDGGTRVDTPTTPSPTEVHRHQTLFDMPHAMIVKQASILYATPTLKSTDTIKTKLPLRKHEEEERARVHQEAQDAEAQHQEQ